MLLLFLLAIPALAAPLVEEDFREFAEDRMHHAIATSNGAPPRFLTVSVLLTRCSDAHEQKSAQRIYQDFLQTVVEVETCGTSRMRRWCHQHPDRTISLMTRQGATSSMARFTCDSRREPRRSLDLMVPMMIAVFVLGIIYSTYIKCKEHRTEPRNEEKRKIPEMDSLESVTLESMSKSTDSSIGTLFTL